MKVFVVVVALVGLFAVALARPDEKYTNKYDNVNLDEVLSNTRLFNQYYACIMDVPNAKCTPDAKELKSHISDALQTECSKCTDKQKEGTEKVIKFLQEKHPEKWTELQAKYDPQGIYVSKYKNDASKAGIKV